MHYAGSRGELENSWDTDARNWTSQLSSCCKQFYETEFDRREKQAEQNEWAILLRALNLSVGSRKFSAPLTYEYYGTLNLKLPSIIGDSYTYNVSVAYLCLPISIFIFTLVSLVWKFRGAVRVCFTISSFLITFRKNAERVLTFFIGSGISKGRRILQIQQSCFCRLGSLCEDCRRS